MCECCGGDCRLCTGQVNQTLNESNQLENKIISRIKDLVRVQERIKAILDDEIFDTLSKHNAYWHSEFDLESDKLDDLLRKFSCMNDNLWDIMGILRDQENEY